MYISKLQSTFPLTPDEFWASLCKTSEDGCWEWSKGRSKFGYGRIYIHPKIEYTHRVAWRLKNGDIPKGLSVCHHCDNPPCCNPEHLFVGTQRDNNNDRIKKGRSGNRPMHGTAHVLAKLTDLDVINIRKTYKPGTPGRFSEFSIKGLAKKYKVAFSLIHRIVKRVSWPHIE